MSEHPDPRAAFLRFRATGDPAALAEVFDATAQDLLRVGVHLCGDAATAEDIVQGTFLAAIEGAEGYDEGRPLVPWLIGILANRVRMDRRRAARPLDVDRLLERAADEPGGGAQRRELAGDLARAIDALPPSLRPVMVLFHRHGMPPADIAHALGIPPGTVRVQLHRGREHLRRRLPAAYALGALAPTVGPRGLDAVREAVLARAAAGAAAASAVPVAIAGAWLMKKVVVAAVVVLLVGAGIAWWATGTPRSEAVSESDVRATAPAAAPEGAPRLAGGAAQSPALPADAPAPRAGERLVRGVVRDRADETPIAGAVLHVHAPRRTTLSALLRRHGGLFQQTPRSDVVAQVAVPSFAAPLTPAQQFADEPFDLLDEPGANEAPLATARSGPDGSFEVEVPAGGAVLSCAREGFASRSVSVGAETEDLVVWLGKTVRREGTVVHGTGAPYLEPVSLLFRAWPPRNPKEREAAWALVEAREGRFTVALESAQAEVVSRTAGVWLAGNPESPDTTAVADLAAERPLVLVARPATVLRVRDARTGAPVEVVHLRSVEHRDQVLGWTGRFQAADGRFPLVNDPWTAKHLGGRSVGLDVWAPGHLPAHVEVTDLGSRHVVDVALEPGEAPLLLGIVRDRGGPVRDAPVALLGYRAIAWRGDETTYVDRATTDADGAFLLRAGAGRYLFRAEHEGRTLHRLVDVPGDAPLLVDLDDRTGVEVLVRDAEGVPRAGHVVGVRGPDGRSDSGTTDEAGRVVFERLMPGDYVVLAPFVTTKGSFGADVHAEVAVGAGARAEATLTLPRDRGPVRVRLRASGPWEAERWRLRAIAPLGEWSSVGSAGAATIAFGVRQVEVEGPEGLRFALYVSKDLSDGAEIGLPLDGPVYEGVLVDPAGEPHQRLRVTAHPLFPTDSVSFPSVETDTTGRFRLPCAATRPHVLLFGESRTRPLHATSHPWWMHGAYEGVRFTPSDPPGSRPLRVVLPRAGESGLKGVPTRRLSGRVLREDRGAADLHVFVESVVAAEGGLLCLAPRASIATTGRDGSFDLRVPRAPRYRTTVHDYGSGKGLLQEEWEDASGASDMTRDFVVR